METQQKENMSVLQNDSIEQAVESKDEIYRLPKILEWSYLINTTVFFLTLMGFYFFKGGIGFYNGFGGSDEWIYNIYSLFVYIEFFVYLILFILSLILSLKNKNFKLFIDLILLMVIIIFLFFEIFSVSSNGLVGSVPIPAAPVN